MFEDLENFNIFFFIKYSHIVYYYNKSIFIQFNNHIENMLY